MRCKRCGKPMRPRKINHNVSKQECAKCHYLGQSWAYPGGRKQTFCKRGHLLINRIWNNKLRRDCIKCQIQRQKQRLVLA